MCASKHAEASIFFSGSCTESIIVPAELPESDLTNHGATITRLILAETGKIHSKDPLNQRQYQSNAIAPSNRSQALAEQTPTGARCADNEVVVSKLMTRLCFQGIVIWSAKQAPGLYLASSCDPRLAVAAAGHASFAQPQLVPCSLHSTTERCAREARMPTCFLWNRVRQNQLGRSDDAYDPLSCDHGTGLSASCPKMVQGDRRWISSDGWSAKLASVKRGRDDGNVAVAAGCAIKAEGSFVVESEMNDLQLRPAPLISPEIWDTMTIVHISASNSRGVQYVRSKLTPTAELRRDGLFPEHTTCSKGQQSAELSPAAKEVHTQDTLPVAYWWREQLMGIRVSRCPPQRRKCEVPRIASRREIAQRAADRILQPREAG